MFLSTTKGRDTPKDAPARSVAYARDAIRAGLSAAVRATAARNGLYDLYLVAATGVLDKMPDVDDALVAGVGAPRDGLRGGAGRLAGPLLPLFTQPRRRGILRTSHTRSSRKFVPRNS